MKPRKKTRKRPMPPADMLEWQLQAGHIRYEKEFKFHPKRRWRADFYLPTPYGKAPVLVEVEGGVYSGGRHTRGLGYENDVEKYNEATLLGYMLIRCTTKHVRSGQAYAWIERALA